MVAISKHSFMEMAIPNSRAVLGAVAALLVGNKTHP
jgi:hypothetical protein